MTARLALTAGDKIFDGINHPSAATVLADGLRGALLYCGTPNSSKDVTAAQYFDYTVHGLWTLLCYENGTDDIAGGASAGAAHATAFVKDCLAKHIAFTEPALAAVDEHVSVTNLAGAVAYQRAFRDRLHLSGWFGPIGVYGFPEVLEAMHAAGVAEFYFGAGSRSAQPAYVNIWQDNTTTIQVGGSADDQDWVKIPLPSAGGTVATLDDDDKAWLKANLGQIVWSYRNTAAGDKVDMHQALEDAMAASGSDLTLDQDQSAGLVSLMTAVGKIGQPNVDQTLLAQQISADLAALVGNKFTVTVGTAA